MARLYLDRDLNRLLGVLLALRGHDVLIAVDDPARRELPDAVHLLDAASAGRIFLTQSQDDFLVLHQALAHWSRRWGISVRSAGIIIVDIFAMGDTPAVASALDTALRSGWSCGEAVWRYNHQHVGSVVSKAVACALRMTGLLRQRQPRLIRTPGIELVHP